MKKLILAAMLLGLSANVYAEKKATDTGVTATECKYNKSQLARIENPEAKPEVKKPAAATPVKVIPKS